MFKIDDYCELCNKNVIFSVNEGITSFREAGCNRCGRHLRNNDVLHMIKQEYGSFENLDGLKILNTASVGSVHEKLKNYNNYICSDFFDGVPSGKYRNGILCVDLCNLPFENNSIDLIISEDIFEHIEQIERAFSEISRVLKPGGKHIFTVPICEGKDTVRLPDNVRVNHLDYLRPEGIKVTYDFGMDVCAVADRYGQTKTTAKMIHKFYNESETTDLLRDYNEYKNKASDMLSFFKYNSIVLVSTKMIKKKFFNYFRKGV